MIKYGGNPNNPNKRRATERISGGPGDRKPASKKPEDIVDPSTIKTAEDHLTVEEASNVVDLHSEDRAASLAMAREDWEQKLPSDDPDYDPNPGTDTLYNRQIQEAHDPESSAYQNGRIHKGMRGEGSVQATDRPTFDGGAEIEEKFDSDQDEEKKKALRERSELGEKKAWYRNGLQWFLMKGNGKRHDNKLKKRGGG